MTDPLEDLDLPERTCILTRITRQPEDLIRFALSPDGEATPDLRRKLPGRGAWLTADRKSVEEAMKKRLFARAFKAEVKPADGLADLIDRLMEQDALAALSLANKAGVVTLGFMKVEAAITARKVAVLLAANDAAEDGLRKMRQVVSRNSAETSPLPSISLFSTAQLSLCLGRENVIHGALSGAAVSDRFVEKCRRLMRYRVGVTNEPGLDLADFAGPRPSFI
jgi:uncharacterized protein